MTKKKEQLPESCQREYFAAINSRIARSDPGLKKKKRSGFGELGGSKIN